MDLTCSECYITDTVIKTLKFCCTYIIVYFISIINCLFERKVTIICFNREDRHPQPAKKKKNDDEEDEEDLNDANYDEVLLIAFKY